MKWKRKCGKLFVCMTLTLLTYCCMNLFLYTGAVSASCELFLKAFLCRLLYGFELLRFFFVLFLWSFTKKTQFFTFVTRMMKSWFIDSNTPRKKLNFKKAHLWETFWSTQRNSSELRNVFFCVKISVDDDFFASC